MRILTVRNPWAQAIVWAGKDVENRTRNVAGGYRGPVAIHAAARVNPIGEWYEFTKTHPRAAATLRNAPSGPETFGAVIGVVDLVDVHWSGMECSRGPKRCHEYGLCSPWAEAYTHHLVLANPRPLAEPIPYRGALGLRTLDDEMVARIEAAIA
ncbi:hypothetical protein [Microbacterium sp.]|uniref:hypothetical protein n=1 Tax=Microbacterium sp. TaxID=51671 RepID=UPI003A953421